MGERIINCTQLTKQYDDHLVVDHIDFWVKKNQFLTILGPSGCGKTTTLRMIAGFETPTEGHIYFEKDEITQMPSYKRPINTVFQKYSLFPHLNIYDNIAFGLKIKKMPKSEIDKQVKRMLKLVNLEGFEKRKINSLSGGQQQRIAIARALVNQPKVLLLDEPLGALDLKLRKEMQIELKNMQKELGITFIYVTHDQEEALTMSDKIIVMNEGHIQQIGKPIDIYNEPENAFVAKFIGESNIFEAHMIKDFVVNIQGIDFECLDEGFGEDVSVDVVIRPEDIDLTQSEEGKLVGVVESILFKGVHYEMIVNVNNYSWLVHSTDPQVVGSKVSMSLTPDDIHIMNKSEYSDRYVTKGGEGIA